MGPSAGTRSVSPVPRSRPRPGALGILGSCADCRRVPPGLPRAGGARGAAGFTDRLAGPSWDRCPAPGCGRRGWPPVLPAPTPGAAYSSVRGVGAARPGALSFLAWGRYGGHRRMLPAPLPELGSRMGPAASFPFLALWCSTPASPISAGHPAQFRAASRLLQPAPGTQMPHPGWGPAAPPPPMPGGPPGPGSY